jgi:hypothetical protein
VAIPRATETGSPQSFRTLPRSTVRWALSAGAGRGDRSRGRSRTARSCGRRRLFGSPIIGGPDAHHRGSRFRPGRSGTRNGHAGGHPMSSKSLGPADRHEFWPSKLRWSSSLGRPLDARTDVRVPRMSPRLDARATATASQTSGSTSNPKCEELTSTCFALGVTRSTHAFQAPPGRCGCRCWCAAPVPAARRRALRSRGVGLLELGHDDLAPVLER